MCIHVYIYMHIYIYIYINMYINVCIYTNLSHISHQNLGNHLQILSNFLDGYKIYKRIYEHINIKLLYPNKKNRFIFVPYIHVSNHTYTSIHTHVHTDIQK
jgi:hypothetical protein